MANEFIIHTHRHSGRVVGAIFAIGLYRESELIGVAILSRPISRRFHFQQICEVTRVCGDGTKNVNSKLYGVMARIARELGFSKIITYTLASESGVSLRAAGWKLETSKAGKPTRWNGRNNAVEKYPSEYKKRWSKSL